MIGKTLLAYIIISLLQLPLVVLGAIPAVAGFLRADSAPSLVVRLVLAVVLLLVYLPICFYIAASAVGFCPPVATPAPRRSNAQPQPRSAQAEPQL